MAVQNTSRSQEPRFKVTVLIMYGFLLFWAFAQLYPFFFLISNSLKQSSEILASPWTLPAVPQFGNYWTAWQGGNVGVPLGRYFLNSLIITTGSAGLVALIGALAAYALARFRFPGLTIANGGLFFILAVPVHAVLIPVFHLMGDLNLRNSYIGIIGLYGAFWLPFTILLLRAHFESFPGELIDAGRIDGCSELGAFFRIAVPVSKGAIFSVSIVNMITLWSELLFAFIILNNANMKTITVGVLAFQGQYATEWSSIFAAMSIATMPMVILFIIFQGQITKGFSMGAFR